MTRLNVRDKVALLRRLMDEFAGGGRLSLEGDLSKCSFREEQVLAREELGVLKRNTLWPKEDFIVLRLEPETVTPIFKQIVAAGLSRAIVHVQIEQAGTLQLGAYDNFHPECVVAGPAITVELLCDLKSKNVLRDFQAVETRDRTGG